MLLSMFCCRWTSLLTHSTEIWPTALDSSPNIVRLPSNLSVHWNSAPHRSMEPTPTLAKWCCRCFVVSEHRCLLYARHQASIVQMRPLQTYGRSLWLLIRFLSFTRATLCYSHGPVSVCVYVCLSVCQVGVLLKRLNQSRKLPCTYPTRRNKEMWVSSKIMAFPSGTLSQTPDLENITSAY